jgi:hypothetical protein
MIGSARHLPPARRLTRQPWRATRRRAWGCGAPAAPSGRALSCRRKPIATDYLNAPLSRQLRSHPSVSRDAVRFASECPPVAGDVFHPQLSSVKKIGDRCKVRIEHLRCSVQPQDFELRQATQGAKRFDVAAVAGVEDPQSLGLGDRVEVGQLARLKVELTKLARPEGCEVGRRAAERGRCPDARSTGEPPARPAIAIEAGP